MKLTRRGLLKASGIATLGGLMSFGVVRMQQSAAPQEFSKTEQADLHIALGEFYFQVVEGEDRREKNALIELPSAQELLIRFLNEGAVLHEIHMGRPGTEDPDVLHSYRENLFGGGVIGSGFLGLHLKPGQEVFLHLFLPENSRGDWEIGCFVPGHYQAGMHAPLTVV